MPRFSTLACFEADQASSTADFIIDEDTWSLRARCHVLDSIQNTAYLQFTESEEQDIASNQLWFAEVDTMASIISSYPTGQDIEEAKWRTMIGNETEDVFPAPDDFGVRYQWHRQLFEEDDPWLGYDEYNDTMDDKLQQTKKFGLAQVKMEGCRFCVTSRGYFGMVPPGINPDDLIFVVSGSTVTFAMRKLPEGDCHIFLGAIYIHDITVGERARLEQGSSEIVEFR
jgi:hypothetical protein